MNQTTTLYKLMSDETRLRIMCLLYKESLCVCEISGILDLPQPKISKSLSKLRDLGLVEDHRNEKFVFYQLIGENNLLNTNMEAIFKDLNNYPMIHTDHSRLPNKNDYIDQCSLDSLEKLQR